MSNQRSMRMDVSKLSDDDLQDMFTESYGIIASENGFDSFECICKRTNINDVKMEVTVVGMAGSPTIDDYKSGKVKGANSLIIKRDGKGTLKFNILPKETISLNTNDYMVIYKAE